MGLSVDSRLGSGTGVESKKLLLELLPESRLSSEDGEAEINSEDLWQFSSIV